MFKKLFALTLAVVATGIYIHSNPQPHLPEPTCEDINHELARPDERASKLLMDTRMFRSMKEGCWDGHRWTSKEIENAFPHIIVNPFDIKRLMEVGEWQKRQNRQL